MLIFIFRKLRKNLVWNKLVQILFLIKFENNKNKQVSSTT
jgi:hypothetical protein